MNKEKSVLSTNKKCFPLNHRLKKCKLKNISFSQNSHREQWSVYSIKHATDDQTTQPLWHKTEENKRKCVKSTNRGQICNAFLKSEAGMRMDRRKKKHTLTKTLKVKFSQKFTFAFSSLTLSFSKMYVTPFSVELRDIWGFWWS